jgi:hypothetical protein
MAVHELTGSVVALIDDPDRARGAVSALNAAQFPARVVEGDAGRELLLEEEGEGLFALMRRLVLAFGDETGLLARFASALEEGAALISVDVEEDQAPQASRILMDHGGHDMWRLGEWSFNPIGEDHGDPEAGEIR